MYTIKKTSEPVMTNAFPRTHLMGVLGQAKVIFGAHIVCMQNSIAFSGPAFTCPGAPGHPPGGPRWGRRPSGWWVHGPRGRPAGPRATGISPGPGSRLPSRLCLCRLCLNINTKECDCKSGVAFLGDLTLGFILNHSFSPSLFNDMMTFSSYMVRFYFPYKSGCWFSAILGSGSECLGGHFSVQHSGVSIWISLGT